MHGLGEVAVHVHVLTDFQKHAGHAGVLTDGHAVAVGDLVVFDDAIQNVAGDGPRFLVAAAGNARAHVFGQAAVGFDAQTAHGLRHVRGLYFSHGASSFYRVSWRITSSGSPSRESTRATGRPPSGGTAGTPVMRSAICLSS